MNLSLSTKLEVKENPERSQQQSEQTGQRWVELDSGLMEESSRQPEPTPQVSGLKGGSRKRPVADEAESSEVFPLDRQRLCEGEPKLETEADIETLTVINITLEQIWMENLNAFNINPFSLHLSLIFVI